MPRCTASGRLPKVIVQQTAQTLATCHHAGTGANLIAGRYQAIGQPLVIPLSMKMATELRDGGPQTLLPKENQPIKAFGLQAAKMSLQMSIQIGGTWWKTDRFHS